MTKKYGRVYISWIGTMPAWARDPDDPPFSGQWEAEKPIPNVIEDGPGWQTVEEAIAWGRERAPVVLVFLGSTEDEIYSAGEQDPRGSPKWPPPDWPRDPDEVDLDVEDYASTFVFLSDDAEKRPPKELYAVFRRPRNEGDRRAGELARRVGALDVGLDGEEEVFGPEMPADRRAELALGDVVEGEGRLVLSGLGGAEDMLYVAPTTTGHIAYAILPNGGGGCTPPGPDGLVLATASHRDALVVQGLVADPIIAVEVVVDGERRPARMGENAFGLRIEGAATSVLETLILVREDGTANELALRVPQHRDS